MEDEPKKYKTVCAIIINKKNEILLTKRARKPFKGKWAIISGIGESIKGTSPEIGVIEEVNCDLGTKSYRGTYLFSLPVVGDKKTDEMVVFAGTINEQEVNINPEYSEGIKWVPESQRDEFKDLAFGHSQIIEKYLEGKTDKQ
ncbi:MAG: NUDIX domain-containing protein [Candidatus Daviesbacteria bacterium]